MCRLLGGLPREQVFLLPESKHSKRKWFQVEGQWVERWRFRLACIHTPESLPLAKHLTSKRKPQIPSFSPRREIVGPYVQCFTFLCVGGLQRDWFLCHLSQSTDNIWHTPDVRGPLRTKGRSLLVLQRTNRRGDRRQYNLVASILDGEERRVKYVYSFPTF